jgi:uncharacterized protein YdhG (YjbR/CyaY superfamily)
VGTFFRQRSENGRCDVSKKEIDDYLASLEEPKRSTLTVLRQSILDVIPEAEQSISYGLPDFRVQGKVVAGFGAFENHLSYLPHSGSVFPGFGDELAPYKRSTGALQFPVDTPLPRELVRKLVTTRMRQAQGYDR